MSTRAFSVTVRQPSSVQIVNALVCVNDRCGRTGTNGRARVEGISTDWHQVQLTVSAPGWARYSESVNLDPGLVPPFGDVEWPDLYLQPEAPSRLRVEGDRFLLGSDRWLWRGSTDFRIPEQVLHGIDVRPILQDRRDAGANLLRLLSMKKNNTGWELNPRDPRHADMMRRTFDLLGNVGLYGEWVVFADTKHWMSNRNQQQEYYARQCEIVREYPHIFLELLNEDKHSTQAINAQAFSRPAGILASHGSGLTDKQPVSPFWDYATYHARRTPAPPSPKPFTNYNPYQFRDGDPWPLPCPFVPEESVKPEEYGYNPAYARMLGLSASAVAGGTFHHSAWNEARRFTPAERACAEAFYRALETP